jgi:tellurium resistance protein TerZ
MALSLSKGQKISLNKEGKPGLNKVVMGLGWDVVQKKGFMGFGGGSEEIDLDASVIMFNGTNQPIDVVFFRHLQSNDGSIVHSGDNRTGAGDGDDEQITVDLARVHPEVKSLVFTVNSFTGQTFEKVQNAKCRLLDARDQSEIATFNLSALGNYTAQIMAKLYRHNDEWKMHAIGEMAQGTTFDQLIPQVVPHL